MLAQSVHKAVFPAAGFGTSFLPATKSQPKEMLPLVDKPIIQYAVEEASASGLENIIIITGRGKSAIEQHFDASFELERTLETRGQQKDLSLVRAISDLINVSYIRQSAPLGVGHAVKLARPLVGNEPFAVVLPDVVVRADVLCLKSLVDVYGDLGHAVIAVMEVPAQELTHYGVVDVIPEEFNGTTNRLFRVRSVIEKPPPGQAPSNLAMIGRYIFPATIFDCLDSTDPDSSGELQLTDGIAALLEREQVYAYRFEGSFYDIRDKLSFLKAVVELTLGREDLGVSFREYLRSLEFRKSEGV